MSGQISNYINHIVFVVDKSGSMGHLRESVVKVFDGQISHLAKRSQEMDQETRVSVFLFDESVECIIYDKDVLRLPSLRAFYRPDGQTALVDATIQSIRDLQKTPEQYGDHAFLAYVVTDGQENASRTVDKPGTLSRFLGGLADNWTVAVLVPDRNGEAQARMFGFPADNIAIWDTRSAAGLEQAGERIRTSTEAFMQARAKGIRGTRSLFLDTKNLTKTAVKENLNKLSKAKYVIANVRTDATIRDFVEAQVGTYVKGGTFYELTKPEKVQNYKQVCVRDRKTGEVYSGTEARDMLGLPDVEVRVQPANFSNFDIFVQSTSVNRKLIGGTKVLILQ